MAAPRSPASTDGPKALDAGPEGLGHEETAGDLSSLAAGREAARRYAWQDAYRLLNDAEDLSADDLEALAEAAWWLGYLDESIEARERAYVKHLDEERPRRAAKNALTLAKDNYGKLAPAVGAGWLTRAERLLEGHEETPEYGYLTRLKGVIAFEGQGDVERGLEYARQTLDIGTRFQDRDLQALGLHDQGRMLAAKGQVEEGMRLMDEVNVAAVSGELSPMVTGFVYCNTITACESLADFRRAGDWTDAAKRWCERQAISGFPGLCRVHRATIVRRRGRWPEAEQEARRACAELETFYTSYAAEAFYEIGELRLGLGDLDAAEEAFRQAKELGREPEPGLALLRLAQGKTDAARRCLDLTLEETTPDLKRARLLPALVEVTLTQNDLKAARRAAAELEQIASTYGSEAFVAEALKADAAVLLAAGEARAALKQARQALRLFRQLEAPYEAAQVRLLLARCYRAAGLDDDAVSELQSAAAAFDRLGALPDARRAHEELAAVGAAKAKEAGDEGTATFMFTDIERSTTLLEAIGDDAFKDLLRWHDDTLRLLFARHGGDEVDKAGDGFFVAFPSPKAALACAVDVQRTLREHRQSQGFAPQVRIGLHQARAVRSGRGWRGKGVHEAARIAALGEGGQIVGSLGTLESAGAAVGDAWEASLKGVHKPVTVATVAWH